MVIDLIKEYPRVRDAAITQQGKKLSLAVIVDYATSESYAQEMGDNFMRMVKAFGPEESPGKKIGKGVFDYLVGIYSPDQALITMGAKVSFSDHITW